MNNGHSNKFWFEILAKRFKEYSIVKCATFFLSLKTAFMIADASYLLITCKKERDGMVESNAK